MLFNSLDFLIFLPIVVGVCFCIPQKFRYLWLLAASYYFYMCWNAQYVLLILFSTVITYFSGIVLERLKKLNHSIRSKKLCVAVSFTLNLAVLVFFKYFDFVFESLSNVLRIFNVELANPDFDILLPVGISFYTFQALSYTVDVYRDEIPAEKNFFRYALFVSFFPQLVAGPIERSKNLLHQLKMPPKANADNLRDGTLMMLFGYFLKVVLADRLTIFVDKVYGEYEVYGGVYLIAATLLFAVQIYCDFAGYSIIAKGTAKILGIELMDNFNAPYLSLSVGEFWRRWHISLSTWFKDYLYIPLGGNRKGKIRKYINLMIVFLTSGLWHGADWSYVVWGGINGLYQVVGYETKGLRDKLFSKLHIDKESAGHRLVKMVITFVLIDFSWIFFRAENISHAFNIIKSMLTVFNPWIFFDGSLYQCGLTQKDFTLINFCILLLLIYDILKYKGISIVAKINNQPVYIRWIIFSVSTCFILLFGVYGPAYNASSFIYFQF